MRDLEKVDPNLSVVLRRDTLKDIVKFIKTKHKSIRQFSIILGCNNGLLNDVITGRRIKTFRLSFLRKIERHLRVDLSHTIKQVNVRFRSNCFIPMEEFPIKPSTELSLVGHSFGDGHISKLHFHFSNKNKELIKDVIKKVKSLPIKNIKVNKRFHKGINLQFPKLVRTVLVCFGSPEGVKYGVYLKCQAGLRRVI